MNKQSALTNAPAQAAPAPRFKYVNDGSYKSIERQLEKLATMFFGRSSAIGIAMDREDIVQELRISYLKARNSWKEDGGSRFSTYFQTCACRHFNHRILKEETERSELGMGSMSALIEKWGGGGDEDSGDIPHSVEMAMGTEESPQDSRERTQNMHARLARLSLDSRMVVMKLLIAERDRSNANLGDICLEMQITGSRLRAVRVEFLAEFDVKWMISQSQVEMAEAAEIARQAQAAQQAEVEART
jgi:RNA polymerase sigma factor (sigma-70 family)